MTAFRNTFIDPAGVVSDYDWPLNHETEEQFGASRSITHTANTANIGLVRQQGSKEPLVLRYAGTILTAAQHLAMWGWFNLCETQTIYFRDFEGNEFEVIVTAFQPIRKRVAKNPRDPANAPRHVWTYSIEMDVIRVIAGPLSAVLS